MKEAKKNRKKLHKDKCQHPLTEYPQPDNRPILLARGVKGVPYIEDPRKE